MSPLFKLSSTVLDVPKPPACLQLTAGCSQAIN